MKTIRQTVKFKAQPKEIYEALLDSKKHSAFTNSKAEISRKVGGNFSAYQRYIQGKNLELIKNKKIIQSWTCTDFPKGHFSKITITLKKTKTGTTLFFTQTGVPGKNYKEIKKGWYDFYWIPLKEFLES